MNIKNLILLPVQITGNNDATGILLGQNPGYDYQNGKRTDMQTHVKYEVVFPENNFEKKQFIKEFYNSWSDETYERLINEINNMKPIPLICSDDFVEEF